ncbi:SDR family oxidoreductase [Methylocystis parvus]|uniref:SDR family oxidoreductase n=1 Tax=Methylocystis parvus TaxID=134 RepID=UPI003C7741E6
MKRVLVTGATGRTGAQVLEKLRRRPAEFQAFGFARVPAKAAALFGDVDGFFFGDVTAPDTLRPALAGIDALVILTSSSLRRKAPARPDEKPQFDYAPGGTPEIVDYLGQKAQIDAAREAGIGHIVLVGSMGGMIADHPLNRLGDGEVLVWKRKAEACLIDSGIDYTIVRPGGLIDQPGGARELLTGKDDNFLKHPIEGAPPVIPRADVAEVVVQALLAPQARNKAFDLISKPEESSAGPTTDFAALFAQTTPGL